MIDSLITKFSTCTNRIDVDNLIKIFSQEDIYKAILVTSIERKEALAVIIREKIVTLIFARGDIASRDYFYLYGLF